MGKKNKTFFEEEGVSGQELLQISWKTALRLFNLYSSKSKKLNQPAKGQKRIREERHFQKSTYSKILALIKEKKEIKIFLDFLKFLKIFTKFQ